MNVQTIPCPVCQNPIQFERDQLLSGVKFSCTNCKTLIGLTSESESTVKDAMKKFERIKEKIKKRK